MSDRAEAGSRPHAPIPAEQLLALTEGGETGAAPVPPPTLGYVREPVVESAPPPPPIPAPLVRRSLTASVLDASAWAVMAGTGERNFGSFLVLGGSTPLALALINAIPGLIGAGAQWLGAEITDVYRRRRRLFVLSSTFQALTWTPLAFAIFLPPNLRYWAMLVGWMVYVALSNLGAPSWHSVMGDLVPANWRGRFFALRGLVSGAILILVGLAAGGWLDQSEALGVTFLGLRGRNVGFFSLFLIATLARLVSAYFLSRMHDPPYHPQPSDHFTLWQFLRRAPFAQYGRFVLYQATLVLGTNFAGVFFGWYMLRADGRHFTLYEAACLWAANSVTIYAIQPVWGALIDRFGTKRMMTIGGYGIALVPVFFMLSTDFWYWMAVHVYDGIVWSAWGMACYTYMFDIVTPPKRARCTAFSTLVVVSVGMLGSFAGACCAMFVPLVWPLPWNVLGLAIRHPFGILLMVSAVLRLLPNVLLLPSFKEFRIRPQTPEPALASAA